ncbi:Serine/threonine-protein kinase SBK2 [Anabarilius grahami]|uniref:Serine/threonine-protein kinase SBK2 n=1 Tax=Anabarilius grahami TaxID=495550 RepID=A0A3N0XIH6_ANAGA|nr:Serine/threonine-protein kinase SBK2 [Anabarilius grahami]
MYILLLFTCQTAPRELDELCYLTAQSMTSLVTSEHFKLIKKLGEGSYGKVMLAVHQKRGTPMALKFFPRRSTSLQAFLREYNLSVSYCTHPSLTRAIGIFYSTPSHYVFAQEAGLYGDLYDVIVSEEGVSEECAQRVMSQLSGAVSHLHSLGFVHRDIKPENIFLCDRVCRWVKLGDFGLARAQGTKVRAVWYNSPFCVPEMECAKRVSEAEEEAEDIWMSAEPSLDTWALGILIYCLLTSCFPWEETTSDDPSYCKYRDWFNRIKQREERVRGQNGLREGDHCEKQNTVREENETELEVAPQFDSLSSFVLTLLRKLLNPLPLLRPGPEEILSYLGGPWLLKTEKEEMRREQEAHMEAKKLHERGGVEEGKEILGRRER